MGGGGSSSDQTSVQAVRAIHTLNKDVNGFKILIDEPSCEINDLYFIGKRCHRQIEG